MAVFSQFQHAYLQISYQKSIKDIAIINGINFLKVSTLGNRKIKMNQSFGL